MVPATDMTKTWETLMDNTVRTRSRRLAGWGLGGTKLERLSKQIALGRAAWGLGKTLYTKYEANRVFTIEVDHWDDVYVDLVMWLSNETPDGSRRSLEVRTSRTTVRDYEPLHMDTVDDAVSWSGMRPWDERRKLMARRAKLYVLYAGRQSQTIMLDGHKIVVTVERGDAEATEGQSKKGGKADKIIFTAKSAPARDAVIAFIQKIADDRVELPTGSRLFLAGMFGDWRRRDDIPKREISTVVLDEGLKEEIVRDLNRFFNEEDVYAALGVPWHRGYVFEGPPGTGKTTLARALATFFNMDLYYLPLGTVATDADLITCIGQVPPRSMLLLEDADVYQATQARTEHKDGGGYGKDGALAALLNALDGVATPHGLVTVMTTNKIEAFDEAILRPGRADRVDHIGFLTAQQLNAMCDMAVNIDPGFEEVDSGVMPASIIEVLRNNLRDPEAAVKAAAEVAGAR